MKSEFKITTGIVAFIVAQVIMIWPPYNMVFWQLLGMNLFLSISSHFAVCLGITWYVSCCNVGHPVTNMSSYFSSMMDMAEQITTYLLKYLFFAAIFAGCVTISSVVFTSLPKITILSTEILILVYILVAASIRGYAFVFSHSASSDFDAAKRSTQSLKTMSTTITIFMLLIIATNQYNV